LKFYGAKAIERKSEVKKLASKEQVERIKQLQDTIKHDTEMVEKMFAKEDVEDWADFEADHIEKAIKWFESKMKGEK